MAVLIFRHVPLEPAGRICDSLDERGIEWRYVDLWRSFDHLLPVDQAQALVSMGGPMSVNDPLPWLRQEEQYLTRAICGGVPVLGICLGAQLLAKCLGAQVKPMPGKEIGWYPVRLREPAMEDPLFRGLQREETVFHWHGETFGLPAGAEWLVESDLCGNQAFRHGSNLYGLQFHPEVTPEMIDLWCREDANCGDLREAEGPIDPEAHAGRLEQIAKHLFGHWCKLIAER